MSETPSGKGKARAPIASDLVNGVTLGRRAPVVPALWIGGTAYFILLGGNTAITGHLLIYLMGGTLMVGVTIGALWAIRGRADAVDAVVAISLLLYLASCALSQYPRQSLDAAFTGTAYASSFLLGRRVMSEIANRRLLIRTLAIVGVSISLVFFVAWIAVWMNWFRLTNSWPPLGLYFGTGGFGYRNDVPLLLALLAGPVWTGRPRSSPVLAWLAIGAVVVVMVIAGSRMVWISTLAAAGMAFWATARMRSRAPRIDRRLGLLILAAVALVAAVAGPAIAERSLQFGTLSARGGLWSGAVEVWNRDLLAGLGPGTFPLALQGTSYARANALLPEHADNAVVQVAAEAGLLGLLSALVLIGAIGIAWWRGRLSPLTIYALVLFALNSVTANPTENPFHVVVLLAVLAHGAPISVESRSDPALWFRRLSIVASGFLLVAGSLMAGGRIAYAGAAAANRAGDIDTAIRFLTIATRLDPATAIFWRELGLARLATGDTRAGFENLRTAAELLPSDAATQRAVMFGAIELGDTRLALVHARRAAELTSGETDLIALAWAARVSGDSTTGLNALAAAVRIAPWTTGSTNWAAVLPQHLTLADVTRQSAAESSTRHDYSSHPVQQAWLAIVSGEAGLLPDNEPLGSVDYPLVELGRCEPQAALAASSALSSGNVNDPNLWAGILISQSLLDAPRGNTFQLANVALPSGIPRVDAPDAFLRDRARDRWLFGLDPLSRGEFADLIPHQDGLTEWIYNPQDVAQQLPLSLVAKCAQIIGNGLANQPPDVDGPTSAMVPPEPS